MFKISAEKVFRILIEIETMLGHLGTYHHRNDSTSLYQIYFILFYCCCTTPYKKQLKGVHSGLPCEWVHSIRHGGGSGRDAGYLNSQGQPWYPSSSSEALSPKGSTLKQGLQLGIRCSNTLTCGVHFMFKPRKGGFMVKTNNFYQINFPNQS